jgi:hypothetical protein
METIPPPNRCRCSGVATGCQLLTGVRTGRTCGSWRNDEKRDERRHMSWLNLIDAFCPVFCSVFAQLEWLNHLLTFQFQELEGTIWVIWDSMVRHNSEIHGNPASRLAMRLMVLAAGSSIWHYHRFWLTDSYGFAQRTQIILASGSPDANDTGSRQSHPPAKIDAVRSRYRVLTWQDESRSFKCRCLDLWIRNMWWIRSTFSPLTPEEKTKRRGNKGYSLTHRSSLSKAFLRGWGHLL